MLPPRGLATATNGRLDLARRVTDDDGCIDETFRRASMRVAQLRGPKCSRTVDGRRPATASRRRRIDFRRPPPAGIKRCRERRPTDHLSMEDRAANWTRKAAEKLTAATVPLNCSHAWDAVDTAVPPRGAAWVTSRDLLRERQLSL